MEMATSQIVLQGNGTAEQGELYIAFELGDKQWKLSCSDGRRGPSRYSVSAGDKQAVLDCIGRAKARCALGPSAKVRSCYEAGRDGWWLHRWLLEQGVDNIVVDSASIEVNRRARRAKNDRLDADKLLAMLQRYCAGERRVWSVLRTPTVQEDRIGSLLVLHNLRAGRIGGRDWAARWASHTEQVPPALRIEIEREVERLALVKEQTKAIEARQREEVASDAHPLVTRLSQLRAIGLISAWKLDKELFGWRNFANRRQLGASLGLTPTPYDSGNSQIEQGISKAGNKRLRTLLVELAWSWLRYQPDSALSQWYGRRFAAAGKRMRRVGCGASIWMRGARQSG
jgi:transposase